MSVVSRSAPRRLIERTESGILLPRTFLQNEVAELAPGTSYRLSVLTDTRAQHRRTAAPSTVSAAKTDMHYRRLSDFGFCPDSSGRNARFVGGFPTVGNLPRGPL